MQCEIEFPVLVKCPFGHPCFFDDLVAYIRCTKCDQDLKYEYYEKWMRGDMSLIDLHIFIKVPKLIINFDKIK